MDSDMENYETLYKEVCRICLSLDNDAMVALLEGSSELTCYGKDIETFTHISIKNVKAPPKMCQKCLTQLNETKLFIDKCKTSQAYFENIKNCSDFYRKKIVVDTVISYSRDTKNTVAMTMDELKMEVKPKDVFKIPELNTNNMTRNRISNSSTIKPISVKTETDLNNQIKNDTSEINIKTPNKILKSQKNNFDIKIELVKQEVNQVKPVQTSKITNKVPNEILNLLSRSNIKIKHIITKNSTTKLNENKLKTSTLIEKKFSKVEAVQESSKPQTVVGKSKNLDGHYVCDICQRILKTKSSLIAHLKRHKPKHCCELCGKACPTKSEFQCHLLNKHGIGEYIKCPDCDFKTCVKHELLVHKSVHTGERPYVCDQCGMDFRTAYVFKNHLLVHAEKTIQCTKCPRKFRTRSQLSIHDNNVHFRRLLYECPICQRVYARNKSVRKHLAKTHLIPRDKQGKIPLIKVNEADETQLAMAAALFSLHDDKLSK